MTKTSVICPECGHRPGPLAWRCPQCGAPLEIESLPPFDHTAIVPHEWSLWRYARMLPVSRQASLGEGMTPLAHAHLGGIDFRAKLEYLNPTGSYKDRGTATMISHMLAHGASEVVEDSSGNAGASVAAYSSAGGIRARIFVPADALPGKKALIAAFGGALVEVDGPQRNRAAACVEAAKTTPYASHSWSPYFILGQMTAAWEIWEQLGGRAPDAVICPVGQGCLFLGLARGFRALDAAGLIERLPAMVAVQSSGCDPIVRAWESGADAPEAVTPTYSVADGILINTPAVRGREILATIRATGGAALRVEPRAILAARDAMTARGFVIEPTSAAAVAALPALRERGEAGAEWVVMLTGSGLKLLGGAPGA